MRVAFVLTSFPLITETFVLDQIEGLLERGYQVDVFADRAPPDKTSGRGLASPAIRHFRDFGVPTSVPRRILKAMGLVARWLPRRPRVVLRTLNFTRHGKRSLSLRLLFEACATMDRGRYDIIHAHFGPNGQRAIELRELGAISGPIVTSFYGYDVYQSRFHGAPAPYAGLASGGALFVALSEAMKERLVILGFPGERVVIRRLGVALDEIPEIRATQDDSSPPRIVTIGRLVPKKGIANGLRAIARLREKGVEPEYWIVGDGPLRSELENLALELGLGEVVRFTGWVHHDEVFDILGAAKILLAPCIRANDGDEDGTPMAILEAMAFGIPVVSTRVGSIPEMVEDGTSGFLVEPDQTEALARSLGQLCKNPDLCQTFGRRARDRIIAEYTHTRAQAALLEIYELAAGFEQTDDGEIIPRATEREPVAANRTDIDDESSSTD